MEFPAKHLAEAVRLEDGVRIVDIGANPMNHKPPYAAMLGAGLCHVVGFEPQQSALDELNARKGPNETYLPYAVGDGGRHTLNLYRGGGLASLFPIRRATVSFLRGLRRAARGQGSEALETMRLDDIAEVGRVDHFKIDIQGGEPMVFEHASRALSEAVCVHSEVSFFPLYEGHRGFGEVDVMLRKAGFLPHSFASLVQRVVLSRRVRALPDVEPRQMLDGDIVYFRDLSQPDGLSDQTVARTAMIAEAVYGFRDLALRCVDILEDRDAINSAALDRYLKAINAADV